MSLFVLLKFLHVLLAIIAVGFNATYGVWLARVAREPVPTQSFVLKGIKRLDDWFANPAYASAEGCSPSAATIFFRPCSRMSGNKSIQTAPARSASLRAISLKRSIVRAREAGSPKPDPAGERDQSGCGSAMTRASGASARIRSWIEPSWRR